MIITPNIAGQPEPVSFKSYSFTIAGLSYSPGDFILGTQVSYNTLSVPAGWNALTNTANGSKMRILWTIASGTTPTNLTDLGYGGTPYSYFTCWPGGKSIGAWSLGTTGAAIYPEKKDGTSACVFLTEGAVAMTAIGYYEDWSAAWSQQFYRTDPNHFRPETFPIRASWGSGGAGATPSANYSRPQVGVQYISADCGYPYTNYSYLLEIKNS